ncbi:MAG: hypothetical protein ACREOK_09780 [Gemmatimonadaceae bacterium]
MPQKLTLASAIGAAGVIALAGCSDEPTRPNAGEEALVPLAATAEERGWMLAALAFASEQSTLALERRHAVNDLEVALAAVADQIERNDRTGVERAVTAARVALVRYRELAPDGGEMARAEIEAMTFTLEQVSELARESRTAPANHDASTTTSGEVLQP